MTTTDTADQVARVRAGIEECVGLWERGEACSPSSGDFVSVAEKVTGREATEADQADFWDYECDGHDEGELAAWLVSRLTGESASPPAPRAADDDDFYRAAVNRPALTAEEKAERQREQVLAAELRVIAPASPCGICIPMSGVAFSPRHGVRSMASAADRRVIRMTEASLTESELRGLMDTWTESHGTFMDAVLDALKAKGAPERAFDDAQIAALIAKYDAEIRANNSPEWNTLVAVAFCEDGIYGAYGEVLDLIDEDADTGGRDWPSVPPTDADRDAIQDAFENYQARLRAELGDTK